MDGFDHIPLLGALGTTGEPQSASATDWSGTVAPGEGRIPTGSTWAPAEGATIAVGKTAKGGLQEIVSGVNWRGILAVGGVLALGGLAYWVWKTKFKGKTKRRGRRRR